jgi:hypothetical protein
MKKAAPPKKDSRSTQAKDITIFAEARRRLANMLWRNQLNRSQHRTQRIVEVRS